MLTCLPNVKRDSISLGKRYNYGMVTSYTKNKEYRKERTTMIIFNSLKKPFSHYLPLVSFVSIALFICTVNCYSAQIILTWDQNSGDGTTGYKIYYGDTSKKYSTILDAGNQARYTITNLIEGKTYFIAITAYNSSGKESGFSKEISYDAYTPDNKPSTAHLKDDLPVTHKRSNIIIQKMEKHWDGPVYAIKHAQVVHRPTCKTLFEELRSKNTVIETIKPATPNKNVLNARINELESQISTLSIKYFDEHPKIVLLKNRIKVLEKQIKEGTANTVKVKTVKANPVHKDMLDSESVTKFTSIEHAIKSGGIACPACKP